MDTDRLDPDLTEALARGREPRKLWPVLHSVEPPPREESPYKPLEFKRPAEYRPLVSMTGSKP